jgi:hypothetical protein
MQRVLVAAPARRATPPEGGAKSKMQKLNAQNNKKAPSGYERARGNITQPLIFQIKLPELAP